MTPRSEVLQATWPARPTSVPLARRAVVERLREQATSDPPLSDIALVVSEAVTNAVNHAFVDREPGSVSIEVTVDADEVELIVEDDGRGMVPRPDSPGLGLGLPTIATVSERFDIKTAVGGGTRLCAWFRLDPGVATLPA